MDGDSDSGRRTEQEGQKTGATLSRLDNECNQGLVVSWKFGSVRSIRESISANVILDAKDDAQDMVSARQGLTAYCWLLDCGSLREAYEQGSLAIMTRNRLCRLAQTTYIFEGRNLQCITIPSTCEILGESCFCDSERLEYVEFETGCRVVCLGRKCFCNSSLVHICLPKSIEMIDGCCFHGCTDLKSIEFEGE